MTQIEKTSVVKPRRRPWRKIEESIGERFGRLVVLSMAVGDRKGMVHARCDCGVEKIVCVYQMRNGMIVSCGCFHSERVSGLFRRHGHSYMTTYRKEYRAWMAARERCNNPRHPSYAHYGGRGISVCPRWGDFALFISDVGAAPSKEYSIDRYPDFNGNYEPGNVRWATKKEQARNRRGLVLNVALVADIRRLIESGVSNRLISIQLKLPIHCVSGVRCERYWG